MFSKITALLLALFFGVIAFLNFAFPDRLFSEHENRYLQEWPKLNFETLFSGYFGNTFNVYIQDQFPIRDGWVSFKTFTERLFGKQDNGRVYFGHKGYLLLIEPEPDQQQLAKNCATLRKLLEELAVKQKDLRSFLLLIPSAASVMPDLLPVYASNPDPSAIVDTVLNLIGQKVSFIDSLAALKEAAAQSNEQLYYKTDHHWTTAGAYAVYQAWAHTLGVGPLDKSAFTIAPVTDRFYGTCFSQAHIWSCQPDIIESWQTPAQLDLTIKINGTETGHLYNPSFLDRKDKYAYFMGGNFATVDIMTGIRNGRILLLVKDSYANAFIPFLTQHYERIVMVDPRYLNISVAECLQKIGGFTPTDFMLLCQMDQFASDAAYTKLAA